ncbi:PRC-barrel domain-containing protein [Catenuloplanes atrovinosus]|uniref:Sporulation protein YlmC with PRC-barrel domain n=1 Tax=Catenuloplanes atrovinosus TaxID=137266 RepID=A0AAE3YQH8_9ACTN|nr:PRC-barrel domain-containing protein [Catenuloplanes atrovinosus]MDR7276459.1 sporulation protein YlmC with PRC-barrel domain [Catenuloplanes atrovinosus]
MTTWSEIKRHRVVDTGSATTVAKVDGVVVDPRAGTVVAFTAGKGRVVHWPDVAGIGDAITVASADAVRPAEGRAAGLLGGDHELLKKRVLTDGGDEIGRVSDLAFDAATGRVTELRTKDATIDGGRLIGCGPYAVIVRTA